MCDAVKIPNILSNVVIHCLMKYLAKHRFYKKNAACQCTVCCFKKHNDFFLKTKKHYKCFNYTISFIVSHTHVGWHSSAPVGGAVGQEQRWTSPQDLLAAANQRMGRPAASHVRRDRALLVGVPVRLLHTGKVGGVSRWEGRQFRLRDQLQWSHALPIHVAIYPDVFFIHFLFIYFCPCRAKASTSWCCSPSTSWFWPWIIPSRTSSTRYNFEKTAAFRLPAAMALRSWKERKKMQIQMDGIFRLNPPPSVVGACFVCLFF